MKYYLDTEFIEGKQDKSFLGIKYGETKPTIDLISIGIVSEDDRKYYAISKDFNIKEAWNRFQVIDSDCNGEEREYWIRKNVLKPIYKELHDKENLHARQALHRANVYIEETSFNFTYRNLKKLIHKYGKSNKQIAEEVIEFCSSESAIKSKLQQVKNNNIIASSVFPEFYAYYADYDWVVFCQLFGTMMDLPREFPMYCVDLKQELDKHLVVSKEVLDYCESCKESSNKYPSKNDLEYIFYDGNLSEHPNYPKQENEHNALSDALWNKQLHEFLNKL